jgi:hypothetical protein
MPKYENDNLKKLESLPIIGEAPSSEKEEKFLREVNEYVFQNLEESGVSLGVTYGNTKNFARLLLIHGAKYRMPRFIARHIENCSKPMYDRKFDNDGSMKMVESGRVPRFQMKQVFSKG